MDRKAKQVGSSSFTNDLFGPKEPSPSSKTLFGSLFGPPPPAVPGRDTTRPDSEDTYGKAKHETTTDYNNTQKGRSTKNDKNSDYDQNIGRGDACYYNSSIYYGGREDYAPEMSRNISPPHNFQGDGENGGRNGSNSGGVSRGNWWKGSLYY